MMMTRNFCLACWAGFSIAVAIIIFIAIGMYNDWEDRGRERAEIARQVNDRSPVIDYGAPGTSYIKQHFDDPKPSSAATVAAGTEAFVCIDNATWLRACPSVLKWWLLEVSDDGKTPERRLDFDDMSTTRVLHHDGNLGPLAAKCRGWMVPKLSPAHYVQTGIVSSYCPYQDNLKPITTQFPRLDFIVK